MLNRLKSMPPGEFRLLEDVATLNIHVILHGAAVFTASTPLIQICRRGGFGNQLRTRRDHSGGKRAMNE